jgi:hypothetical protein
LIAIGVYGASSRPNVSTVFLLWGHQFLYDAETFRATLAQAGSRDTVHQQPGVNPDPKLRGLDRNGHPLDEWVEQFETMLFEGTAA